MSSSYMPSAVSMAIVSFCTVVQLYLPRWRSASASQYTRGEITSAGSGGRVRIGGRGGRRNVPTYPSGQLQCKLTRSLCGGSCVTAAFSLTFSLAKLGRTYYVRKTSLISYFPPKSLNYRSPSSHNVRPSLGCTYIKCGEGTGCTYPCAIKHFSNAIRSRFLILDLSHNS